VLFRSVLGNTEYLPELLKENNIEYTLTEHYLAFFGHQGYLSAWFELPKQNDNPIVYFWGEGQELQKPESQGAFTDFLFRDMVGFASILPKLYKRLK